MSTIKHCPAGLNKAPDGEYWDYSCNIFPFCSGRAFGDNPCPVFEKRTCFAFNIYKRFKLSRELPRFYWDRLKGLSKIPPSIIFLNLMGELFDVSREPRHIRSTFLTLLLFLYRFDHHQYLVATKQPQNIPGNIDFPDNLWIGVSICNQWMFDELIKLLKDRGELFRGKLFHGGHFWLSFEPLYEQINFSDNDMDILKKAGLEWITIGAQTRPHFYPEPHWIMFLDMLAKRLNIPLWKKNNTWRTKNYPEIQFYQHLPATLYSIREPEIMII
ncbi:MAG: DUF5131 family protein [Atribacterota bacterium]|nr:DUF5131 family protein [Atribacterota bacterium]